MPVLTQIQKGPLIEDQTQAEWESDYSLPAEIPSVTSSL